MMLFDCIISQLIVKGISKTHLDFLSINDDLFRKPTWISLTLMRDFSKTHQSSLTLKGGSTSHLGLLPSGKKRKPPYSVLKPLRYKVGGPSEVSPAAELHFAVCDRMDTNRLRAAWCLLEAFSKIHQDFLSIND